ncbi:MAG: hypothetical protein RQ826_16605, partial [Xanthomonadales bacterium]|nr:hypothetical protein [Xanthomonadales bacterium]
MRRRRFIALGATGLAIYGAGVATGIWVDSAPVSKTAPAAKQLEEFARSLQGVAGTGRAWLSMHADRNPRNDLLQVLNLKPAEPLSRADLIEYVAARIKSDFEHSRLFKHGNWWLSETEGRLAALHVALLGDKANEAQKPGFEWAPEISLVTLQRFEPRQVVQGESIRHPNLPDNVLYFALDQSPPPRYVVYLGEHRLTINPSENGFSIRIPDPVRYALFEQPGESPVWLYDPVTNQRQRLGVFKVLTAAVNSASQDFCPIKAWGPQTTS